MGGGGSIGLGIIPKNNFLFSASPEQRRLTALLYKFHETLARYEGDLLVKLASTETVCELWVVYRLVSVVNKLLTNCMYNV